MQLIFISIRPGYIALINAAALQWLKVHLLNCPFKKLTGIDCPGCGFQRSVIALLEGHLKESFHLYPSTIPVLVTLAFSMFSSKGLSKIKSRLFICTGSLIITSYFIKMLF